METDLYTGVRFAELGHGRKQSVNGALIDTEGKLATLQAFEFAQAFFYLVAQVQEALGVFAKKRASIGEANGTGATDKQGLAQGLLELTNGQADSGLRTIQTLGRPGEATFASYGKKDLQFGKIHRSGTSI
jgi:hypothetical protein